MTKSVEKLVDAQIEEAEAAEKLKGINDKLKNIDSKRTELNDAITKQSEEAREAQEKYSEALREGADNVNELYAATMNQKEVTIEYNGEVMTTMEALQRMAEDEQDLKDVKKDYTQAQKDANDAIEKANEQMEPYMQYLNGMADATEKGTENTAKNTEEKAKAAEQAQVSIEMAGKEMEAYNALSFEQQTMATNVTNAVLTMQENVQGALESQMDMFEKFDGGVQISTEQLLENMRGQVKGVEEWENLSALADKGINQGILQKLSEMGPQGSGYVQAFNNMTGDQLKEANELWNQSIDIKGMTNEWGQQLLTSGAANIAGGMENLTPIMQQSGANTVLGLVQGMQQAQKMSEAAGKDLGVKTIESVNNALGVHSPSVKMKESGKNVNIGLVLGMNENKSTVQTVAKGVATEVIKTMGTMLNKARFQEYGKNVSQGLAEGIISGRSGVISAATNVATESIRAAKNALDINSPSRKFKALGKGTMEGYILGIQEETGRVNKEVEKSLDFGNMQRKLNARYGNVGVRESENMLAKFENIISKIKVVAYLNGREVTRGLSDMGVVFRADL